MSHSYCANHVHVVFSTKDRKPNIVEKRRMWKYAAAVATGMDVHPVAIGGMDDHLHLLLVLPPDVTLARVINAIKVNSSRWVKARVPAFAWQRGYAAFSVSASSVPAAVAYIEDP